MLIERTLFGTENKIKKTIMRLKEFEPYEGYYLAFSGGKDSVVIKELANWAGVKYDAHYNLTTIDPPELVRFIKKKHPDVIIDKPPRPFLTEMVKRGFPTRQARWCCQFLKEKGGDGRLVLTGVRWGESVKRKNRKMVESCYKNPNKRYLHVIIDWTNDEVWEFIKTNNIEYCKLYDEGWKRLGCLFCPMAYEKQRLREADLYPKYVNIFVKAFEKLHKKKIAEGRAETVQRWKDGKEMFEWWLRGNTKKANKDQIRIFD